VLGTVRDPASAARVAALGARPITADVADSESIAGLAATLAGEAIDVLVCNAGVAGRRGMALGSFDYAEWERVLRVNLLGAAAVVEALIENVAASERRVVAFLSSRLGSIAETRGETLPYSTSKAALNLLAKGLAVKLAHRGVVVVALSPGWARTDMGGAAAPLTPEASVGGLRAVIRSLGARDSGRFLSYDGAEIPW